MKEIDKLFKKSMCKTKKEWYCWKCDHALPCKLCELDKEGEKK